MLMKKSIIFSGIVILSSALALIGANKEQNNLFVFDLANVEAIAQFESSAGGTKCLGANDMECLGASLNGKCKVQSTNNASIVSCEVVYVELGDCCGTKTVVTTW